MLPYILGSFVGASFDIIMWVVIIFFNFFIKNTFISTILSTIIFSIILIIIRYLHSESFQENFNINGVITNIIVTIFWSSIVGFFWNRKRKKTEQEI